MSTSVRLTGAKELQRALLNATKKEKIKYAVKVNGAMLQRQAITTAPWDTRFLKRNIFLDIVDDGMTAEITNPVEYAPYQEYGTRYIEPVRYMGNAYDRQKIIFLRDLYRIMH